MDIKKFNQRMGRPKFSKGGYIKKIGNRQYFDAGGTALGGPGNPTNTNTTGVGGIAQGLGLNAQSANIQQGTNAAQLNQAYNQAQSGIGQQQNLVNTLTPQAATAVGNQNEVAAQELAMTRGEGPNPAQNQLAQATGTNVANEAALLAGQRGAGANPGMAARNASVAGANTMQNAAGQASTMGAQQQIAAQNNLTNLSNQQIGQTAGATTGFNTAAQNEQNILQNANTSGNNAGVSMQGNINNVNSQASQKVLGGLQSGLSAGLGLFGAEGGEVTDKGFVHPGKHKLDFVHKMTMTGLKHFDDGGYTSSSSSSGPSIAAPSPAPSSGGSAGGGGGMASMLPMLAALKDGGPVPSPSPAPLFDPSQRSTSATNSDLSKNIGSIFAQPHAEGGPIQANPLLTNIPPSQITGPQYGEYTASSATSGPEIAAPAAPLPDSSGSSKDKGSKKSSPKASQPSSQQQISNDNAQMMGGPSSNKVSQADLSQQNANMMGGASDVPPPAFVPKVGPFDYAQGGEIFNIHPSKHEEYIANHFKNYMSKGGEAKSVPAMVSANERYLNPEEVEMVKHGADPKKLGYKFPGVDKVPGKNSLKNDTIPATLEEGGVVIPLEVEKTGNSDKMRLFTLKSLRATGKHMKRPKGMS